MRLRGEPRFSEFLKTDMLLQWWHGSKLAPDETVFTESPFTHRSNSFSPSVQINSNQ